MVENKEFNFFDGDSNGEGEKLLNSLNNHYNELNVKLPKFKCCEFNYMNFTPNENENYYYLLNQSKVQTFLTIKGSENPFTEILLERFKTIKNFKILIFSEHESLDEKNFKDLVEFTDNNKIDQDRIYLINNGSKWRF